MVVRGNTYVDGHTCATELQGNASFLQRDVLQFSVFTCLGRPLATNLGILVDVWLNPVAGGCKRRGAAWQFVGRAVLQTAPGEERSDSDEEPPPSERCLIGI